jgi:hypothetical protein
MAMEILAAGQEVWHSFLETAAYLFSFPKQKQLPTRLHQKSPKEEEKNKLTKQE